MFSTNIYIAITCLLLKVWSNEYDVYKLASRTAAVPVHPSYQAHFPKYETEPQTLQSGHWWWWLGLYQDRTICFAVFRMSWTIHFMELKKIIQSFQSWSEWSSYSTYSQILMNINCLALLLYSLFLPTDIEKFGEKNWVSCITDKTDSLLLIFAPSLHHPTHPTIIRHFALKLLLPFLLCGGRTWSSAAGILW